MANKDLTIYKGKTFTQVVRWETTPFVYKNITGITQSAPVTLTVPSHGVPDGWRVMVEAVKGMTNINTGNWERASVVDANTIELNEVNSLDFKAYASGGSIKYYTPADLSGLTGRMKIKDKVGGTVLASTEVGDSPKDVITVTLDNTAKTIAVEIAATDTAAFTAKKGVYDLELVSGSGVVTGLLSGSVTFVSEVTT